MSKINKITPLTNVKFLNLYELEAENKFGDSQKIHIMLPVARMKI